MGVGRQWMYRDGAHTSSVKALDNLRGRAFREAPASACVCCAGFMIDDSPRSSSRLGK